MRSQSNPSKQILIALFILALCLIISTPVAADTTSSPLMGTLHISSSPSGATVVLDGINKGITPVTVQNILAGSHTLSLKKSGYYDYHANVTIVAGKTKSVSATLVPVPPPANGTIAITSAPSGAAVIIDTVIRGSTPGTFKNITPGNHFVVVNMSGYLDYKATIQVMSGLSSTVDVTLVSIPPAPGTLVIKSIPPLATVVLDNVNKGITPLTLSNVGAGSHVIILKKTGYTDYKTSIAVTGGKTVTVSATLSPIPPKSGSVAIKSTPALATVLFDNVDKGITPVTLNNILAGNHAIVLKKTGYTDYKTSVIVTGGKTVTINATMSRLPPTTGSIVIKSIPSGATIFLDTANKGTTPRTLDNIAPGSHTIVVKNAGYIDNVTTITVVAGRTATFNADMSPVPPTTGSISIKSTPTGAAVFLDSVNKGLTPVTLDDIAPGRHSVILRAFNYKAYLANVTVVVGKTVLLNASMTKN